MLITKEVQIRANSYNKSYYKALGYQVPKINDFFTVKIEDLQHNSGAKVKVQCEQCGAIREISYYDYNHNKTRLCQKCSIPRKYSIDIIRDMFKNKGYTLLSDTYESRKTKLNFICNKHTQYGEQETTFNSFLDNMKNCRLCKNEDIAIRLAPNEQYLKQICLDKKSKYIGYKDGYLYYVCDFHQDKGIQKCGLYNFKKSTFGCSYCAHKHLTIDDLNNDERISKNVFIIGEYVKDDVPIKCQCRICNKIWNITPNKLKQGRECPYCKESKGEKEVAKTLEKHNIIYQEQYKFDNCKYKNKLPFDFYLPEYNTCIEYQGIQHYEPVDYFGGHKKFELQQKRDNIKREYCKKKQYKVNRNTLL